MLEFVDNGGVQLCMERRGNGEEHVLFLHGWISARRMWYDVVERLDPGRFTMHLLDFRGNGLSDRPRDGHDLLGYVCDARAALAAIDSPVVIAAHSMGGKVAQYLASERPKNLAKLILAAPGTAAGGTPSERQRLAALDAYGSREKIAAFQRAAMTRQPEPAILQRTVEDALVAQFEHWYGWYDRGRFEAFAQRLALITAPTLCIAGGKDPLVPPSRAKREVAQAIAGCLLVTLRDAGHNLPIEAPEEIAQAITSF